MAKLCLVCLFAFSNLVVAQVLKPSQLPPEIKYSGKIQDSKAFIDNLGEHILISSSLSTPRDQHDEGSSFIFVYDYLKKDGNYVLNWKLEDGIERCDLDYEANFKVAPIISDVDQNGVKEVTMVYSQTCAGDVSPSEFKVIMRENKNKYALRGLTFDPISKGPSALNPCCLAKIKNKEDQFVGGMYRDENDFKKNNTPKAFLPYAKKIWIKYR